MTAVKYVTFTASREIEESGCKGLKPAQMRAGNGESWMENARKGFVDQALERKGTSEGFMELSPVGRVLKYKINILNPMILALIKS